MGHLEDDSTGLILILITSISLFAARAYGPHLHTLTSHLTPKAWKWISCISWGGFAQKKKERKKREGDPLPALVLGGSPAGVVEFPNRLVVGLLVGVMAFV